MAYYYNREPIDYNPGFPPRSPSPLQFPEYSLWGDPTTTTNFNKAPQRPIYPPRVADDGPRRYYHNAADRPKSSRIQEVEKHAWPPFAPDREGQRSMSFGNFPPRRSPNQFTEEQPMQPEWHNVSRYDEQRFSGSPPRPDDYCGSPFQTARRFSENPQPLMSVRMQRPSFLTPTGRSDEYCRPTFQPSGQYDKDSHKFLLRTEPPQRQFPSQRSDEHTRSSFSAYNGFMKFAEDRQPLIRQPYRHQSPRNEKDSVEPSIPQTWPFSSESPLRRPNEYSRSQFRPSVQQYNSRDNAEDPSYATPLPDSQEQSNMQFPVDVPQVLPRKRTFSPESGVELQHTYMKGPSNKMPMCTPPQTEECIEIEDSPKPELTDSEEKEVEVVIERKSLYIHPDNFQFSDEIDPPEPQEQAGTSSGSSGEWTSYIFKREGAPSSECNLKPRVLPRGQKTNTLNKKLVKALSQPVKMEKGAKMMHRMGWIGGGLGKDGTGIVDPIAPNAIYATTTVGFGQEVKAIQRLPTKREARTPCLKRNKNKKMHVNAFKANVLLNLLKFATNDLQLELYFDALLKSNERKRIHRLVEAIGKEDTNVQFGQLLRIVVEIRKLCPFTLSTQSDGEGEQRKICVFKEAPENMFLVTPDDCRPCLTDINVDEDEPNPFLRSIKNHIKEEPECAPAPPYLIDKLVELFVEFCNDEAYSEFRFLGPFTKKEITVINCFLTLIDDLTHLSKPKPKVPIELLEALDGDNRFFTEMDPNGFTIIKKIHVSMKEEYEKLLEEERERRLSLPQPVNHWPEQLAWRTEELLSDN